MTVCDIIGIIACGCFLLLLGYGFYACFPEVFRKP
jgi:hypothetical protein